MGSKLIVGVNDLATVRPDLAAEWHPAKNGSLKPTDVTVGSNKKVWWYLPYDDTKTGRHFDFEWQAGIANRSKGDGCPYLSGHAVWKGFNDLATVNPKLAEEWHPTKNGNLNPDDLLSKSNKKVWWRCKNGHEWWATVCHRTDGAGCPCCSGRNVIKGVNDLATLSPELSKEWHPTKNGKLTPQDVGRRSNKVVWWLLPYDDPDTGKHFDFEWQDTVECRTRGYGCPYLTSHAVWKGFNDLATMNPELAKEWHPVKNGALKASDVTCNSSKKVWWLLPYDDPKTGKHYDFEWYAEIASRNNGVGCPYLSKPMKDVWKGFNDLGTTNPELAKEWHPTKNGSLTPSDIMASSHRKVWWYLPYDDPKTGKHFDFEWKSDVQHRSQGRGCPYFYGNAVWQGYNDLATLYPEIAKEWHPTKNGNLRPEDVTAKCKKNVWWYLPYNDPKTGEHFEYEWVSSVSNRTKGNGCPYISESKGEQDIMKYFDAHNIKYKFEKTFDGLRGVGGGLLSYDFWLENTNVLVEYQGIQHYGADNFFGGEEAYKKQKEHDRRKREYARENGYHLIEIKHTYNTYDAVAGYLDEHLRDAGIL